MNNTKELSAKIRFLEEEVRQLQHWNRQLKKQVQHQEVELNELRTHLVSKRFIEDWLDLSY